MKEETHDTQDLLKEQKTQKKRKDKNVLSFQQRIQVILDYQNCPSARLLSEKYGCGKTQILNIMRNKKNYLEQWSNAIPQQRTRTSGLYLSLGVILYEWIERAKAYSSVITIDDIRKKGKEIAKILNITSFYPTTRWLTRFRKKYNITDESLITNPDDGISLVQKSLKIEDIMFQLKNSLSLDVSIPISLTDSNNRQKNEPFTGPIRAPDFELSYDGSDGGFPIITSVTSVNKTFQRRLANSTVTKNIKEYSDMDCDDSTNETNNQSLTDDVEYVEILPDTTFGSSDDDDNNSFRGNSMYGENSIDSSNHAMNQKTEEISSYKEALEHLKLLENFAFLKNDLRAIGMINQLENYLKERVNETE